MCPVNQGSIYLGVHSLGRFILIAPVSSPAHPPCCWLPGYSAQLMLSPDELTALIIDPSRTELTLVDLSALQESLPPPTASPTAAAQDPQPRPTPKVAAHRFSARAPPSAGGQGGAGGRQGAAAKSAGGAASAAAGGAVSEPQYEAFAAACWSPDSARVAVVCRSGNLYLLERYDAYTMGTWCRGRGDGGALVGKQRGDDGQTGCGGWGGGQGECGLCQGHYPQCDCICSPGRKIKDRGGLGTPGEADVQIRRAVHREAHPALLSSPLTPPNTSSHWPPYPPNPLPTLGAVQEGKVQAAYLAEKQPFPWAASTSHPGPLTPPTPLPSNPLPPSMHHRSGTLQAAYLAEKQPFPWAASTSHPGPAALAMPTDDGILLLTRDAQLFTVPLGAAMSGTAAFLKIRPADLKLYHGHTVAMAFDPQSNTLAVLGEGGPGKPLPRLTLSLWNTLGLQVRRGCVRKCEGRKCDRKCEGMCVGVWATRVSMAGCTD